MTSSRTAASPRLITTGSPRRSRRRSRAGPAATVIIPGPARTEALPQDPAAAASTAATTSGATKVTCTFRNYTLTPTQLSGFGFGYISCPQPFGPGVPSATYTTTVNAKTGTTTLKGTYKNWFDTGTVYWSYSLRGQYTSATAATYKGTFTIKGGTGTYKGMKTTGALTCSTTNAGATSTCTSVEYAGH
jgi:hypothetical protein